MHVKDSLILHHLKQKQCINTLERYKRKKESMQRKRGREKMLQRGTDVTTRNEDKEEKAKEKKITKSK